MSGAAANGMTRITLSFLLSLLSDNNTGPEAPVNSKHHWSYKGPEGPHNWPLHYKQCGGERQSPIDIQPDRTIYDSRLGNFHLDNFNTYSQTNGPTMLNVTNNGHAASVRVTSNMRVSGGGLNGTYKTAEFHFHWGSSDEVGSEHALDGRKFPLEMHVVNFAEKYGTIKDAMTEPDGLAVLGVFFELSDTDNPEFSALGNALNYVQKAGEHNIVDRVRLGSLLPDDISRYWRYSGSLTTPFCFETVTWTVFTTPQKISRSQLDTLRSLLHEDGHDKQSNNPTPSPLVDNWRPIQPLNGRTIHRSFEEVPTSYVTKSEKSSNGNNVYVLKTTDNINNHIVLTEQALSPSSSSDLPSSGKEKAQVKNNTNQLPQSPAFPSKVKIKIGPSSNPNTNSVASTSNTDTGNLNKDYKNSPNEFAKSEYAGDVKNNSRIQIHQGDYILKKNNDALEQLQKQRKLIELQKQQQLQKLMQLQKQQQLLNNQQQQQQQQLQQQPQPFGAGSSLLPNIQTLEAQTQSQDKAGAQQVSALTLRNGPRILNDGIGRGEIWGRQSNQPNAIYSNTLPVQNQQRPQQLQQQRITGLPSSLSPSAPSPQAQQRYVKPLDPKFQYTFLRDGNPQQNQQAYLQPRQHQHQHPLRSPLKSRSSPTSYTYNSQYANQRQQLQLPQQHTDLKNSLFSQLTHQQAQRLSPTSGYQQQQQQRYRTYSEQQQSLSQRQNIISRQQQQQQQQQSPTNQLQQQQLVSGSKANSGQLRTLLQKLTSNTRQSTGPQTLISPARRMLPQTPLGDANSISRAGISRRASRNGVVTRDSIPRTTNSRLTDQSNGRVPSTLTSGMNPIPYSTNQRLQRLPGQRSTQPSSRLSSSQPSSSKPSSSSSASLYSGNPRAYQYNRNRQATSYSRPRTNSNWFFTDMNAHGGQQQQEELPYVFLHRIQKPIRIRRPFYERLYNI